MKKIKVKVTTRASANKIVPDMLPPEGFDEFIKIYTTAVPENGKANKSIINMLAKHYGIAKSKISITHGLTTKEKTLLIDDS